MKVLISILSDYLQPNFLLIKEFINQYEKLIFISTNTMESQNKNKSQSLIKALNLCQNIITIINIEDDEDNYNKLLERFSQQHFSKDDDYILNLTGGTKIIPMAVYNFFRNNNYRVKAFYVPIGKNIIKSVETSSEQPINYKMSLKEYFDLQGLQFETNYVDYSEFEKPKIIYQKLKKHNFDKFKGLSPIDYKGTKYSEEKKKKYLCGEWFEEYCFNRLKTEQGIPNNAIVKGARIFKNSPDEQNNEVDVMFVKDNNLYFFECKVIKKEWDAPSINSFIYKLAAITKNYGLSVNSYLLTLSNMEHNTNKFKQLENKIKLLGIKKVFGYQDFEKPKLDLGNNTNSNSVSDSDSDSDSKSTKEPQRQPRIIRL